MDVYNIIQLCPRCSTLSNHGKLFDDKIIKMYKIGREARRLNISLSFKTVCFFQTKFLLHENTNNKYLKLQNLLFFGNIFLKKIFNHLLKSDLLSVFWTPETLLWLRHRSIHPFRFSIVFFSQRTTGDLIV